METSHKSLGVVVLNSNKRIIARRFWFLYPIYTMMLWKFCVIIPLGVVIRLWIFSSPAQAMVIDLLVHNIDLIWSSGDSYSYLWSFATLRLTLTCLNQYAIPTMTSGQELNWLVRCNVATSCFKFHISKTASQSI